ncbi:ANR family transcriptional regulator [Salmonella enterica subsp. enterica serovar Enteritidis]|nr:ANR family transcriptional regulator [Salmonella enterica subsp. enterica serovar Enteritidis]
MNWQNGRLKSRKKSMNAIQQNNSISPYMKSALQAVDAEKQDNFEVAEFFWSEAGRIARNPLNREWAHHRREVNHLRYTLTSRRAEWEEARKKRLKAAHEEKETLNKLKAQVNGVLK